MLQAFDPKTVTALERLLAQPDPPELKRRGHVHLCDGDPNRRVTKLPNILATWLQRRHLSADGETF